MISLKTFTFLCPSYEWLQLYTQDEYHVFSVGNNFSILKKKKKRIDAELSNHRAMWK